MGLDKTPCRGIYRILCGTDLCNQDKDKISPDCIGCPSSAVEIISLDDKVLNTIPVTTKEEEKKKLKSKALQVAEITE